jgi:hypothetical protein
MGTGQFSPAKDKGTCTDSKSKTKDQSKEQAQVNTMTELDKIKLIQTMTLIAIAAIIKLLVPKPDEHPHGEQVLSILHDLDEFIVETRKELRPEAGQETIQ